MEEIMFKLFERQPNWTLKQLIQETDQPEVSCLSNPLPLCLILHVGRFYSFKQLNYALTLIIMLGFHYMDLSTRFPMPLWIFTYLCQSLVGCLIHDITCPSLYMLLFNFISNSWKTCLNCCVSTITKAQTKELMSWSPSTKDQKILRLIYLLSIHPTSYLDSFSSFFFCNLIL